MNETNYPSVEEMSSTLADAGVETKGVCYNGLTLLFSLLAHNTALPDILSAAERDRRVHKMAGQQSFFYPSALDPFDGYR